MTIGMPSALDRPDRVRACTMKHRGPCTVCGFDGAHHSRVQPLERRQVRAACTCGWYGPIRQGYPLTFQDRVHHRQRVG
jgi:hypothetical protein